jgi:hypothetical protein
MPMLFPISAFPSPHIHRQEDILNDLGLQRVVGVGVGGIEGQRTRLPNRTGKFLIPTFLASILSVI